MASERSTARWPRTATIDRLFRVNAGLPPESPDTVTNSLNNKVYSDSSSKGMFEQQRQRQQAEAVATETTTDPAIVASAASVILAWYQFFIRGNQEMGLFVGLWPPTILAFASYFNQTRMSNQLRSAMGMGSNGVMDALDQFMRNR